MIDKMLIFIISLEHFYIMWIEMFSWTKMGKKVFKSIPEDLFEKTKGLAANQGLYNGFLAVGLLWSIFEKNVDFSKNISIFFLGCIIVAGIYGAISSDKKIYIEDYAFTYINSIAYNNPMIEQAGVLLGELQKDSEEKCVFVKGVIKSVVEDKGERIHFDENVWNRIYSDTEKY